MKITTGLEENPRIVGEIEAAGLSSRSSREARHPADTYVGSPEEDVTRAAVSRYLRCLNKRRLFFPFPSPFLSPFSDRGTSCRAGAAVSLICPFKQKAICYPVGLTHGPSGVYARGERRRWDDENGRRREEAGRENREKEEEEERNGER